ncbi:uncharacterized protein LOC126779290 isoform X2 [Nymphalis io]|uniref:uncharacterized protein LOC126779290 isoform X2 n=1 Tax=Inachis io TaxID=171585 RepID=UPI0021691A8D|nr:uncharacterized protein LOC126779290 isoform X2 [Nymphalis io]
MSSCKNRKTELIAIYRLEFYKKQNNWKLGPNRKDKKSSEKSLQKKINLNVTYNLDHPDFEEQSDPLNVAFVDSDSDKTTQTKCLTVYSNQRNKELSQEWLEPVNIWPSTESSEDRPKSSTIEHEKSLTWNVQSHSHDNWVGINSTQKLKTCTRRRLEELQKAANAQEFTKEQANEANKDGLKDDCRERSVSKTTWVDGNVNTEWKTDCYQNMPTDAGVLSDSRHTAQDIWTQPLESDVPDGLDCADVMNPDDWKAGVIGDAHWISEWSLDSEAEFVRGAHAAPHSSEAELALPAGLGIQDVSLTSLSQLSSSQLMIAARLHSRVLRRLLLESEQRQKLRNATSMNSFSGGSFDEYPTRDTGPYGPGNRDNCCLDRNIIYNDVFLAGSFKNVCAEGRGRGRGRLNETSLWR